MFRTLILLLLILLLPSCANLNEETEAETYAPEMEVSDKAFYSSGTAIFMDWHSVRGKPLIAEGDYCEPDEIEFDPDTPSDPFFIDYGVLGIEPVQTYDGRYVLASKPDGNFLTDGDEFSMKLCPDEVCRANEEMACTHINLVGGYVWGNYVYTIGKYKAEDQPGGRQWMKTFENYLLRYSIPNHEQEVVAEIPWHCYIAQAAYGVLYIAYTEDIPYRMEEFIPGGSSKDVYNFHTIIYDCENVRMAKINHFDTLFLTEGKYGDAAQANGGFYYLEESTFRRFDYDLDGHITVGTVDWGGVKSGRAKMLGYAKDRIFYTLTDNMTGEISVRSLKDDGTRRVVVESCFGAALTVDGPLAELYVIEKEDDDTVIARYRLDRLGKCTEREVMFTESGSLAANEHVTSIESEKTVVRFTTSVGQYTGHKRTYLLTELGAFMESERGAPEVTEDEITDIHAENTD